MKKIFAVILSLTLIMAPVPVIHSAHASEQSGAQQLLGLANGIVGATLITKCKLASLQSSVLIYMAGSLTYILGEITTAKKKASDVGNMSEELDSLKATMKEGGDYQRKAVQSQIDNENSNLEFIQKRKMFVKATLGMYGVATAIAVMEVIREVAPPWISSFAACTPNPAMDKIWVIALASAYGTLANSGGKPTAGGMAAGVGLGVAVKVLLPKLTAISIPAGVTNAMALNTGASRIGFFGVVTALVTKILMELNDAEKKAKERIATLQKVLDSMPGEQNALAEGSSQEPSKNNPGVLTSVGQNHALKALPPGKLPQTCVGSDGAVSSSACSKTMKLSKIQFDPKFRLDTLQASANTATEFAQAMIDGDYQKAELLSGDMEAAAARASTIKDAMMKKLNESLVAQGKKPLDIEAETKKQLQQMNAEYAKHGFDSSNIAGSFAGEGAKIGASEVSDAKVPSGTEEIKPVAVSKAAPVQGIDLSGIDASAALENTLEDKLNRDDDVTASLSEGSERFEDSGEEINKDRDVSLFKQVSNRYKLNYTRLFDRKKLEVPETAN
jgi:hypothetical protein